MSLDYTPDGQVIRDFMKSKAFVRGLQGPIGSGKSVACVIESVRLMMEQEKAIDKVTGLRTGPRKVRVGVIRNTTPQLETTTMKTWLDWLPEDVWGKMRWRAPFCHQIRVGDIEAEVWFLALDRDEDVRKLLSFEFTFIWINEARELNRGIITAAISRVKRYPRIIDGGPTRACVIMDTNAPDEDHWWSIMSGQTPVPDWMSEEDRLTMVKPSNWEFFIQPPAVTDIVNAQGELTGYELNPERENGKFTDKTYYTDLLQGQSRDWIRNMLQNQIGGIYSGRPVYTSFSEKQHVADEDMEAVEGIDIHIGVDFGLTPAAAFLQDIRGQVRAFDELVSRDMGAERFAKLLHEKIMDEYPEANVILTGDPRGDDRVQTDERTPYQIFEAQGLHVSQAWTNDPIIRVGALETQMNTLIEGRPGYMISRKCKYLYQGKKGGYCYLKDGSMVDKNSIYSHISDAEQYAVLRMGYGKKLIGRNPNAPQQVQANRKQDLFNRGGTARSLHRGSILSRGRS